MIRGIKFFIIYSLIFIITRKIGGNAMGEDAVFIKHHSLITQRLIPSNDQLKVRQHDLLLNMNADHSF